MSINELADHGSTSAQPINLPRRQFFNDMPDRGLFGLFSLLGFAAIFGLKHYGYDPNSIAILAVVLMVVYGATAYSIPSVSIRPDRLGDNFYYLGFIYTLASLSSALFQMQTGIEVDGLLGSFGIALVTTIIGIIGRVMFVQMRGDLDDIEEHARRDLLAKYQELHSQLSNGVREFETLRASLLQTLQETTDECSKVSKKHASQVKELSQTMSKRVEAAYKAESEQSERLLKSTEKIGLAVEKIGERAASMTLPSEKLDAEISSFGNKLEALLTRLGDTVDDVAKRASSRSHGWWGRFSWTTKRK